MELDPNRIDSKDGLVQSDRHNPPPSQPPTHSVDGTHADVKCPPHRCRCGQIEDSAEMGIGVMVPSNRLIPVTENRPAPAPLQMQSELASDEPN